MTCVATFCFTCRGNDIAGLEQWRSGYAKDTTSASNGYVPLCWMRKLLFAEFEPIRKVRQRRITRRPMEKEGAICLLGEEQNHHILSASRGNPIGFGSSIQVRS